MSNKIIRSICLFTADPKPMHLDRINTIHKKLTDNGFDIQTRRLTTKFQGSFTKVEKAMQNPELLIGLGSIPFNRVNENLFDFFTADNTSFNIELSKETITKEHIDILWQIIKYKPANTFNFTYVFNNQNSSPYFPSSNYEKDGFAIGLQPTDLAFDQPDLDAWLNRMKEVWNEICTVLGDDADFLGIDSSIAPLNTGMTSLVEILKRYGYEFSHSFTTDVYTRITEFIKKENSKPTGLCGLMMPCLEDFVLADEYDKGNFPIERNLFVSLHSGLGIDTYPIGIDENKDRVLEILKLVQALSNKYQKPLSARFVSDGTAKIGERTNFKNQYLKDVTVRAL